ncbi:hypothetical protein WN55_04806 [Dufourea novaeangliae]|uniref:Uncharacterized protein n=1 Tax=Dufourea novaeangliae TaxID=178035 RepID=A0A154PLI4_DUFNO|nr:hypothetical protein WN55_04806 [Dufourea novaeangliae]
MAMVPGKNKLKMGNTGRYYSAYLIYDVANSCLAAVHAKMPPPVVVTRTNPLFSAHVQNPLQKLFRKVRCLTVRSCEILTSPWYLCLFFRIESDTSGDLNVPHVGQGLSPDSPFAEPSDGNVVIAGIGQDGVQNIFNSGLV